MTPDFVVRPEAEAGIDEAYAWYENRSVGLGERFLDSVEQAIGLVCDAPQRFPAVHQEPDFTIRRALVERFRYGVFFIRDEASDATSVIALKWRYTGRTVMLINARAASQAEYTGQIFRAANRTTLTGSPTMAANGDVTSARLPGGMRKGLQPDVSVVPTIAGVRAGRDEVLERAVQYLAGQAMTR